MNTEAYENATKIRQELEAMLKQRDYLRQRNRELREALGKMLDSAKAGVVTYEIGVMQDIAREALRGTE